MDFRAILRLLAIRDYAIYSAGNTVSLIGTWIHRIAIAWLAWEYTRSPFWIGVIAAAGVIPIIIIGPIGGALADRVDQRKQIALSQLAAFALMMGLTLFYMRDWLNIGWLIAFRVALTTLVSLSQPARLVLMPGLVGQENIGISVSFGALIFNLARFIGPAIAGLLLVSGDFSVAFILNGVSYLALVAAILAIRSPEPSPTSGRQRRGMPSEIRASFGYIRSHPAIMATFLLFAAVVLAGRPIAELIPAFVGDVFGRGVDGLAILTSAMAAGSIAGGLMTTRNRTDGLTRVMGTAALGYGACIALFVWVPVFWMAVGVLAVASALTVAVGVSAQTAVQTAVDPDIRGRVMGLWFVLARGGPPLGALAVGTAAEVVGLPVALSAGGALCALAALLFMTRPFARSGR